MKIGGVNEVYLWSEYLKGDENSFKHIYELYSSPLLRYGFKFTQDEDLIAEAVQDLFVKLWKNRKTIGETPSVKNYLYKSFRRVLIEKLQFSARTIAFPITDEIIQFNFELGHDHVLIRKERLSQLQASLEKALSQMSDKQREVIYLKYYEDMSYEEIAEMMDITTKGAYKLLYRALDSLRENLGGFTMLLLILVFQKLKMPW
ncbi:RNA polymerase sigma factor, sigma-70 family [Mucilaginibacter gossypiicola]|uniref:RNA polymerase sigma factor, sigma-70 family n=1 Tax=Mucilaginibacter gossypiicola TaxID=551995 RepID=A0A1H8LLX7_9SPHI|nr:RNA polymerase sigma factor, sigma-70 family [Mucilaginibacter gossypiicola]